MEAADSRSALTWRLLPGDIPSGALACLGCCDHVCEVCVLPSLASLSQAKNTLSVHQR